MGEKKSIKMLIVKRSHERPGMKGEDNVRIIGCENER
jgi:hypothetical protein